MRESLRLHAPTPVRNVAALEDTILHSQGKTYEVKKGQQIVVLVHQSHRDTSIWGSDVSTPPYHFLFREPLFKNISGKRV
jgi:cytochrome P450